MVVYLYTFIGRVIITADPIIKTFHVGTEGFSYMSDYQLSLFKISVIE